MSKKIVLLDLDGTLGNTAPGILASVRHALIKVGFGDLSDEKLNEFIGPPIFDSLRNAGMDEEQIPQTVKVYRSVYSTPSFDLDGTGELQPGMFIASAFDGIPEMMRELWEIAQANGWTIITGTSKPEAFAREIVKRLGLYDYFTPIPHLNVPEVGADAVEEVDGIFGASIDSSRAQKIDVLRYALAAAGYDQVAGDKAVLVGDRHHDIEGAHEAGIQAVGCSWGYGTPGELEGTTDVYTDSADAIIKHPSELLPILREQFANN
jgi:phosphoglycolate phosphatase